jgi:hypothetical protein
MDQANKRVKSLLSRIFEGAAVGEEGVNRDGILRVSLSGRFGHARLDALWIGAGWPADLNRALDLLSTSSRADRLVLIAQRMSPGAIEILRERSLSWADEAGNARIVGDGLVVIRDAPENKPDSSGSFSWSPSAMAVAEALLAKAWPGGIRTTELANLIQRSASQVSSVLQGFDEVSWTVKYGPQRGSTAARELHDSTGLLDAWAAQVADRKQEARLAHRTMRSPLAFFEDQLATALSEEVRWALSGWGAANTLAPMSGVIPSLQIYVHEDDFAQLLDRAIAQAGLADVAEGGRVEFFPAHPSVLALAQPSPIGPLASSPRVYADLLAMGGRGEDAAIHLREEVLESVGSRPKRGKPPAGSIAWEQSCRQRLEGLAAKRSELANAYAQGTWSASYRLVGAPEEPELGRFMAILREVAGHETGWPPWWVPDSLPDRPRPVEGMIECWLSDSTSGDAAHADYWRADPGGRLCLIRGYQEDSSAEAMANAPGAYLDLTLPIWHTGECLLHAARLAKRLDGRTIQFMMRWNGLLGRRLAAISSRDRMMRPTAPTAEDEIVTFIELSPAKIENNLAAGVRKLVAPLYQCFDFFEPPEEIYEDELASMRRREY